MKCKIEMDIDANKWGTEETEKEVMLLLKEMISGRTDWPNNVTITAGGTVEDYDT